MSHLTVAIAVAKGAILVLGGLITYLALVAYRRTGARELRALAVGFGVVTLGSILGGVVDLVADPATGFGGEGLIVGVFVQSVVTLLGFAIITYSLYRE